MDIKEIIKWGIAHWKWFIVSVAVCVILGGWYFLRTAPKYNVEAILMIRQAQNSKSNQEEMLNVMGFGGNKVTSDEVRVLTSRDLIGQVVDTLDLSTLYKKKGKRFWKIQYPNHTFTAELEKPNTDLVKVQVKVAKNGYKVRVKMGLKSQRLRLNALGTVATIAGNMYIFLPDTVKQGSCYSATIVPRIGVIDGLIKSIDVTRLGRESNVITLSMPTTCPERSIDIINTLLDLYNTRSGLDKNRIALQTEHFLATRIDVVAAELDMIEAELEDYKRVHHIADLNKTAEKYEQLGGDYEQQAAELDAQKQVLDYMKEQLNKSENSYTILAGVNVSNSALQSLIADYNNQVLRRNALLQEASDSNIVVMRETELLTKKRVAIISVIDNALQTMALRRQHIQDLRNQYDSRLESIPETERHYLEMRRVKQTKEKQYLFLIEKREENSMLLASEAVPAQIVERAQLDPNVLSPNVKIVGILSLLFGVLIPFCFYFLGIIKKEYF
ncbi:MAG: Wzz/FepE/Etk N-terminal domain-containing protein [Paludibacteraceae bacterium]|nr:Wzz/FepE/Etk N-terminal domain-containing protein [Paludibacteraceae bacterium]